MAISLAKTNMPTSSSFYTASGTGSETVTLGGVTKIILHSKKDLIKINRRKTKTTQTSENTDLFDNQVVDLKNGTDEIVLHGWLEDDASKTAWEKYWILRAMASRGGPITTFTLENLSFGSSTQQAFLEDISGTVQADDTGVINTSKGDGVARIEVVLSFFIGDER